LAIIISQSVMKAYRAIVFNGHGSGPMLKISEHYALFMLKYRIRLV
jgi:hypothetical protein